MSAKNKNIEAIYPLSPTQQGLLFHTLYAPKSAVYFQQLSIALEGELDACAFEAAWQRVVDRHAILRTAFVWEGLDKPLQVVGRQVKMALELLDWRDLPALEQKEKLDKYLEDDLMTGFNMSKAPLMRLALIRLRDNVHQFLWSHHHIIMDGWSAPLLMKEVFAFYDGFSRGEQVRFPSPRPYGDYISWLQRQDVSKAAEYWQRTLGDFKAPTTLPCDLAPGSLPGQDVAYDRQQVTLSADTSTQLQSLARQHQLTLNTIVQGAWALLLSRYSGDEDVVFGVASSGRPVDLPGVESIMGLFVNTLPMRVRISGDELLFAWLSGLQHQQVELRQYEYSSLADAQSWSEVPRGMPLFDTMLAYESYPVDDSLRERANSIKFTDLRVFEKTNYPITVQASIRTDLILRILYDRKRFDDDSVTRMLGHLKTLLESMAANPGAELSQLNMLTKAERAQLLEEFNPEAREYDERACIHELFERQAAHRPEQIAVVSQGEKVSYRELNERANQLASHLQSLGVGPESKVGICMQRSAEMVVGLIGILKAGGAYVPLDPTYPQARLAYMMEDSRLEVIVTTEAEAEILGASKARMVKVDKEAEEISGRSKEKPEVKVREKNLAYVIYTSGSTGRPKGAMNAHEGILNRLLWMQEEYNLCETDRVLQKTPFSFDVSVWEFFWPLMTGARLVMAKPEGHKDPAYLREVIIEQGITTLHFVPSMLQVFIEAGEMEKCKSLRRVICSGEALSYLLQEKYFEKNEAELHNLYGPTEAAVDVSYWKCERESKQQVVPIGRPIANIQLYCMRGEQELLPIGIGGELRIGGVGVGRGYLGRPDLTAERFVPNPFGEPGSRLYRTGDLARFSADGSIEFLGRIDTQVKVRGLRIETGEIEAVLAQHGCVKEAVVIAREDAPGDKRLVAYVVPDSQYHEVEGQDYDDSLAERVSEWKGIYEETYNQPSTQQDPAFNIVGWNSSYTGEPIAADEMREWVDSTVSNILSLKPDRILEIGCGTGLLLSRIAPHSSCYWATDFSEVALRHIRQQMVQAEQEFQQVVLFNRAADNFDDIEPDTFDAIIINSVAQYFPSLDYFLKVLGEAVNTVASGGFIYLGDIRNNALLEAFQASVQVYQAPASLSVEQVRQRIRKRIGLEEELLIDPHFFAALKRFLPKISDVEVRLKRGSYHNELTKFRYDVVLHVGAKSSSPANSDRRNWQAENLSIPQVREILANDLPESLVIEHVPNARLVADLEMLRRLASSDGSLSVDELKLKSEPCDGVEPEDIWALSAEFPYSVSINWSESGPADSFDIIFTRHDAARRAEPQIIGFDETLDSGRLRAFANNPLLGTFTRKIAPKLRGYLKERVPDFMVPTAFVALESFPLSPNGKLDRSALPAPDSARPETETPFVAPRTPEEEKLTEIWSQVLGIEKIGIDDSFFSLGGDSIRSIQVRSLAEEAGLSFSLQQLFQHQTIRELVRELSTQEAEVKVEEEIKPFDLISAEDRRNLPMGLEDAYPLAILQAGMLYHTEYNRDSGLYLDVFSSHLQLPFNHSALASAIDKLLSRHPVLRTSFDLTNFSEQMQLVHRYVETPLQVHDVRPLSDDDQERFLAEWVATEKKRHYDWNCPPLLRFNVHLRGEQTFQFTLSFHHAILDGWSVASMLTELFQHYHSAMPGSRPLPVAPPPKVTFRDFVALERKSLNSDESRRYWIEQLSDSDACQLPRWFSAERASEKSQVRVKAVPLSNEISKGLIRMARSAAVPVKNVLLAAHMRILSLLTNRSDVVTGLVSNGRPEHLDGDRVLGLFLNTLPFRMNLASGTWNDLARKTFDAECEMLPHRRYPMAEVQRQLGRQSLFEAAFSFVHFHVYESIQNSKQMEYLGGNFIAETNFTFLVHFSLDLSGSRIRLEIDYDSGQLCDEQIEAIGAYYAETLARMARSPLADYQAQSVLPETQQRQLLVDWNDTHADFGPLTPIHELFEQQAESTPAAIAVFDGKDRLTFSDLNREANKLAHYLIAQGVGPEVTVGLCLERTPAMIIGLLAILKAGGAYVPLDTAYPTERLLFIAEDSRAKLMLTQRHLAPLFSECAARVVSLDSDWREFDHYSDETPGHSAGVHNLAYIIYTSGTTGRPKGVGIEHRQIFNYLSAIKSVLDPASGSTYGLVSSIATDLGNTVIFPSLCCGGTLQVIPQTVAADPDAIAQYLEWHPVDYLKIVPSHLAALLTADRPQRIIPRRCLVVGGEAASPDLIRRVQELGPDCRILNHYGPTESTVGIITHEIERAEASGGKAIPLGRPIANTQIYLLDSAMQQTPVSVAGELYVAGAQVARGYLDRPDLTAEKFIPNRFSGQPGSRLYKTGDLARYLPDGNIEFLGRADHQIKIRGNRVELGEIEAVLAQHASVVGAVVIAKEDGGQGKYLVAYVASEQEPKSLAAELRGYLRKRLSEYMVPSDIVVIESLPLTPTGKIDRRALPAHDLARAETATAYVAPGTPAEELVASIWASVLEVNRIGIKDNFFDLRGHSLLAMRVVARLRQVFQVDLPLPSLFEHPTIEGVINVLAQMWGDREMVEEIARTVLEVEQISDEEMEKMLEEENAIA